MTVGKAAGLTAAFVGVFALGVAVGPPVRDLFSDRQPRAAAESPEATVTTTPAADPAPTRATPRAGATASNRNSATPSGAPRSTAASAAMPASEPRLHDRLKPVLNRGAQMSVAAEGFRSGEEFATVAHAARNTNVPFMVLKHRVLDEGRTLEEALRDVKPGIDAKAEAARAQAAAKSDVAASAG